MNKELRKKIEFVLLEKFKILRDEVEKVRVKKNTITFVDENKNKIASIQINYSNQSGGYYLTGSIWGGGVWEFIQQANPPYRSNCAWSALNPCLFYTSPNEKKKEFSGLVGGIQSCFCEDEIDAFCENMIVKIKKYHIVRIQNCLFGLPGLIKDVMFYPDDYSYPFVIIVYAAYKQGIAFDSSMIQELLNNGNISRNKQFSREFAKKWLTTSST